MATFSYLARDAGGTAMTGEVVAGSQADAVRQLRADGKFVVRMQESASGGEAPAPLPMLGRRVRQIEVIYFATQLAGMIDTGVPLADALEATIDKAPPGPFRRTIEDVIHRVQAGSDLSAAFAEHPKVFPPLFVHMVRASEATGTLGTMLNRVADYMVNQRELKKKIKGALTYPCCMLIFAIGATVFLVAHVLPTFAEIYAGRQAVLPLPTRVIMAISAWVSTHLLHLGIGTVVLSLGIALFFRTSRGRVTGDWIRLNLPLLGPMFRKACLTRALRSLGAMINGGVSVLEAVVITRDVVGNHQFGRVFDDVHRRLQQGEQLTQALFDSPFFPRSVWQMLHAGERTGQLGNTMEKVADFCEADLKSTIRTTTQFIEPAMIVIMGIVIGGIAIAMLLPIFQISRIMTQ